MQANKIRLAVVLPVDLASLAGDHVPRKMTTMNKIVLMAFLASLSSQQAAFADPLSSQEVRREMLNKIIITRRFGMKVTMQYKPGGKVTARTFLSSLNGTWKAQGNKICSTFPSGPAKGTSCVSFSRLGNKRYTSSDGVSFQVVD